MSEHDLLDRVHMRMQVAGGMDESDRAHFTEEQTAQIREVDDQVTRWLEEDPDRQRQFLKDPVEVLSAVLSPAEGERLRELVVGPGPQDGMLEHVAEAAQFGQLPPEPLLSPTAIKKPQANNDVTFMLSLDALADALEAAVPERLDQLFTPPAPLTVPIPKPDSESDNGDPDFLDLWLDIAQTSNRPAVWLSESDGRVHLGMVFRGGLGVTDGTPELPLDPILMGVPLAVDTAPAPDLSLAIIPDPDAVPQFGSPSTGSDDEDEDDETSAKLVDLGTDVGNKLIEGELELFPDLTDDVTDLVGDLYEGLEDAVVLELLGKLADNIREAVTSWLSAQLLQPGPLPGQDGPLALATKIPTREVLCGQPEGPTDLQADFLSGDVPALAVGLGYGREVELPEESLIGHGWSSWVELSNALILKMVCCLVPDTFRGLEDDPTISTDSSCRWEGGTFRDAKDKEWQVDHVEVSCTDSMVLEARATRSGRGYNATLTLRLELHVDVADTELLNVDYDIDVDVKLKWWAWGLIALGALLVGVIGGGWWWVIGGVVGVGVGIGLEAVLEIYLRKAIPKELGELPNPIRLIPPELTDLLGQPVAERTVWDDLELFGEMALPLSRVTVLDLVGKSEIEAREILGVHGFARPAIERHHDEADKGTVIGQDPQAGEKMPVDAKVTLTVSKGKRVVGAGVRVPGVVGKRDHEATRVLRDAGFKPMPHPVDSEKPHLEVVGQSLASGTKHPRGTTVTISVSKGPRRDPGGEGGEHHPLQPL